MSASSSIHATRAELLVTGAGEVLTCAGAGGTAEEIIRRIPSGAVAVANGRVLAAGPEAEVRSQTDCESAAIVHAEGGVVAPGFVDAHTHLVFGGSRVREYALRLTRTKAAVEALGVETGIMATVGMTRREDVDDLFAASLARLDEMLVHGTTTVESKSGYGLEPEAELKLLRVNRLLDESHEVDVVSTFMGAHDFPPDVPRETYVDQVIDEMIPRVAEDGVAEFCDVFCDDGYYTVDQARRILQAGTDAGLAPKIHADQYSSLGGAELAAELGAVSADHLNFTDDGDLRRLAEAEVVAVLMPLIDFAVQHPRPIEARRWVDAGLEIALGTDLCPGGYAVSMPLAIQFACRWNGLSPEEAMLAATTGSARACGLGDRGAIEPGLPADLQVWDVGSLEDMVYRIGHNPVRTVIKNGKVVV
ncbi:MAG: imidazolonepropionase [marine benthic group bacterium]|nr:imidazolonepropionase [Candidatus Benthicola marisminoris]